MNMLNFVDSSKDYDTVVEGKLDVFQREAYLHEDLYPLLMEKVKERLLLCGRDFPFRTCYELNSLYGADYLALETRYY